MYSRAVIYEGGGAPRETNLDAQVQIDKRGAERAAVQQPLHLSEGASIKVTCLHGTHKVAGVYQWEGT